MAGVAFGAAVSSDYFDYYRSGDISDVKPSVDGGVMLMGGGEEVVGAFQWMLKRAGHGNVVVLRASFADEYHAVFKSMGPMASIETFVFKSREASFDQFLLNRLAKAELIFISGGDQAKYIDFWRHTPVDDLINARAKNHSVVIGGTSAGLAILGSRYFSARFGSVYSDEVLANPFDQRVDIGENFLDIPFFEKLITDTHFKERDRMGRLIGFLARINIDENKIWTGIGVDQSTAVVVDPAGRAEVMGQGAVYLLQPVGTADECSLFKPLTYREILTHKFKAGDSFWISGAKNVEGLKYRLSVVGGRLTSDLPDGSIY